MKIKLFDKEQYKLNLKDYLVESNLSDSDKRYLIGFLCIMNWLHYEVLRKVNK